MVNCQLTIDHWLVYTHRCQLKKVICQTAVFCFNLQTVKFARFSLCIYANDQWIKTWRRSGFSDKDISRLLTSSGNQLVVPSGGA